VNDDKYLNEVELSVLLGVSARTIQRLRINGDGPRFIRISARCIRYSLASCKAWAAQRTFKHRAQELNADIRD
jgi:predicted DNA-binding transcriptional regulator AlpA